MARLHRIGIDDLQGLTPEQELDRIQLKLNSVVFSAAEPKIVPRWVSKALKLRTVAGAPDGLRNDFRTDWVCLGRVGGRRAAFVSSHGLLWPMNHTGSLDIWYSEGGQLVFPSLSEDAGLQLKQETDGEPLYTTEYQSGPIVITRLVYLAGDGHSEAVYNELRVQNLSLDEASTSFFVAIRPFSLCGVEPIESIEMDPRSLRLMVNGVPALEMSHLPSRVVMTSVDNPHLSSDILDTVPRSDTSFSMARGLGTVVLRYDVRLKPARTAEFFFVSPLETGAMSHSKTLAKDSSARDRVIGEWYGFSEASTSINLPSQVLFRLLAQSKMVLACRALGLVMGDSCTRGEYGWREYARVLSALYMFGTASLTESVCMEIAEAVSRRSLSVSDRDVPPFVWSILQAYLYRPSDSIRTYIESNAPNWTEALDGMLSRTLASIPPEDVQQYAPITREPSTPDDESVSDDWVARLRSEMETISQMAEGSGVQAPQRQSMSTQFNFSTLVDLLWILAASEAIMSYARERNASSLLTRSALIVERCRAQVDSIVRQLQSDPSALKQALDSMAGPIDVTDLISVTGLTGLNILGDQLTDTFLKWVEQNHMRRRLVRHRPGDNRYSTHIALRLACAYAARGKRDETEALLAGIEPYVTDYGFVPEFTDPDLPGSGMGDGCSILAAADVLILARMMMLRENRHDLVVLPGIPEEWFVGSESLSLKRAPTGTGIVSVELGSSANQHQVEIRLDRLPDELHVHTPSSRSVSMVKVYGAGVLERFQGSDSAYLRVVPLSGTVVLTYHK